MNETLCKERTINTSTQMQPAGDGVLQLVCTSLDDDKAVDTVVIDLKGKTEIADFMVIASGTSQRQVSAMADHIQRALKTYGQKGFSVEGEAQGDWVLIDAGDVVVHLFRPEVRNFYNLEKMWEAPVPASNTETTATHASA